MSGIELIIAAILALLVFGLFSGDTTDHSARMTDEDRDTWWWTRR